MRSAWAETFFSELKSCWLCDDEVKETGELWLVMHCFIWFGVTTVTSSYQTDLTVGPVEQLSCS